MSSTHDPSRQVAVVKAAVLARRDARAVDLAELEEALSTPWGWGPKKDHDSFGKLVERRPAKVPAVRKLSRPLVKAAMERRRKRGQAAPSAPMVSLDQDIGQRDQQQDQMAYSVDLGLYVVADGMGGHDDGDRAAEVAIAGLMEAVRSLAAPGSAARDAVLQLAMQEANVRVFEMAAPCGCGATEPPHKMSCNARTPGTTLTALWLTQGSAWIAHVGDSRAYHVIGGVARQLTEDHGNGWGLTQYVGRMTEPQILGPLPPSGQYLLCSDGLTGTLPDAEIARVLAESPPIAAARALVQAALANGKRGQDNISAIVITLGPAAEMRPAVNWPAVTTTPSLTTADPAATEPLTGEVLGGDQAVDFRALDASQRDAILDAPALALAPINIQMDGEALQLWQQGGGEPLAKDLDVAAWLGYETPRQIRELIDRHAPSLGGKTMRRATYSPRGEVVLRLVHCR